MSRRFGPYTIQAAIAAVHAEAPTPAATDWDEIVGSTTCCCGRPSPVDRIEPGGGGGDARRTCGRRYGSSTRYLERGDCSTIGWRTRRARICAAGSDASRTRAPPTSGRSRSPAGAGAAVSRTSASRIGLDELVAPKAPAAKGRTSRASRRQTERGEVPHGAEI